MLQNVLATFSQFPLFFYLSVALLGLIVGSFLNVVILRLPRMLNAEWQSQCREYLKDELKDPQKVSEDANLTLSKPASTCPKCGHKIKPWENIPVISWLLLRGQCSNCSNKISARYPIIEATSAALSVLVAVHFGVSAQLLAMLLLTWSLIALTMIDFDHMLLPDNITLPLVWLGLLFNINALFVSLDQAVIGAIAGYMSLYLVFTAFKLVTGKEGMGFGDFKLFAVFGAWFGWQILPMLILIASIAGAIIGSIYLKLNSAQGDNKAIPFGPYLAVGGFICALWGSEIWQWYLQQVL